MAQRTAEEQTHTTRSRKRRSTRRNTFYRRISHRMGSCFSQRTRCAHGRRKMGFTDRLLRDFNLRGTGRRNRNRLAGTSSSRLQNDHRSHRQQPDTLHTEKRLRQRIRAERSNQTMCGILLTGHHEQQSTSNTSPQHTTQQTHFHEAKNCTSGPSFGHLGRRRAASSNGCSPKLVNLKSKSKTQNKKLLNDVVTNE